MDANLAEAIREIQNAAVAATEAQVIDLECDDGKEGKIKVPVAIAIGRDGKVSAAPLIQVQREGIAFAREMRLLNAAGPDQRMGTATHHALESFIGHVNRFKAPNSAVWADAQNRRLLAVLDYHPEGADSAARWGKHRGVYACPLSEAWEAWGGGRVLELEQDDFAALLDARDRELTAGTLLGGKQAPDPATLITLACNLETFSHATAKRERDPSTGRLKLSFTEEKGLLGTVMPPAAFLVHIPVFQDADPSFLEVRLRVTVEDGEPKFAVQIHAAGDVLRAAFSELCERVGIRTNLPVFIGTPEL